MSKRALYFTRVAVVAAMTSFPVLAPAPAGALPNGLDVNCNQEPGEITTAICVISGCPRVHGDYVVDAVHWKIDGGEQQEEGFKCINGATTRFTLGGGPGAHWNIAVQGCRKKDLEGDWCGPWSNTTFTMPGDAKPTPKAPPVVTPPPAEKPPVQCPAGSPTPTVPAGQTCAPIPDVTNAIQASFGAPGVSSIAFNVTNTSNITATCNYTATADSINPLVPKKTTRQFNVPANGSHTESFSGAPTLSTYNVVLSCKDASGNQKAELGHVETSVTW
ncbi:hypothetical protein ACJH6H_19425 [Mycobacterium sp. SMC-21]|uniref:hypothetical protein n=1 Tax=Mycobacterium sp. SMC-21 TaxID=3381632 RepID=UPI0038761707